MNSPYKVHLLAPDSCSLLSSSLLCKSSIQSPVFLPINSRPQNSFLIAIFHLRATPTPPEDRACSRCRSPYLHLHFGLNSNHTVSLPALLDFGSPQIRAWACSPVPLQPWLTPCSAHRYLYNTKATVNCLQFPRQRRTNPIANPSCSAPLIAPPFFPVKTPAETCTEHSKHRPDPNTLIWTEDSTRSNNPLHLHLLRFRGIVTSRKAGRHHVVRPGLGFGHVGGICKSCSTID